VMPATHTSYLPPFIYLFLTRSFYQRKFTACIVILFEVDRDNISELMDVILRASVCLCVFV